MVQAITDLDTDPANFNSSITGTATAANLLTISAANGTGTVTVSAGITITGSATDLLSVIADAAIIRPANYNATITGASTVTQVNQIDSDTVGTVSIESVTDTFINVLNLAANNAAVLNAATGTIIAEGSAIADNNSFANVGKGLTIYAYGGADQIIGTALNDVIVGGAGLDVLYGGSGSDTFQYALADSTTGAVDQIMDFAALTDRLDLAGTATIAANATGVNVSGAAGGGDISAAIANGIITLSGANAANVDSLAEWVSVARLVNTTIGATVAFEFDDNATNGLGTYVYQENAAGNSSSDLLVFLSGVEDITALSTTAGGANTLFIV